jgi:hypothetical protein
MVVVLEWEQGPENLCDGWLFNVGCQKPQPSREQNFEYHAHLELEPYNSFLLTGNQEASMAEAGG